MIYKISSPAKINLGLKVLNKRTDGFHNIETTFQFLNWGDDITIETKVNKNELNKLFIACESDKKFHFLRAFVECLYLTLCRRGELLKLKRADVNWADSGGR